MEKISGDFIDFKLNSAATDRPSKKIDFFFFLIESWLSGPWTSQ